jgi:hypothetical protein
MSKFVVGEKVEKTADEHEDGIIVCRVPNSGR